MKHSYHFDGIGGVLGDAHFIVKDVDDRSVAVFRGILWVDVTLGGADAEAYRRRYSTRLHVEEDGGWFKMEWMGEDGPQLCLTIQPDVARAAQDTMEAHVLAQRAVDHLNRLLCDEV